MSIFRSEKMSFLKVDVTKDGLIKTMQVVKKSDGSIPDVALNDNANVISKDIPFKSYKGLLYALPMNSDAFLTISYPAIQPNKYVVEKRDFVKID